MNDLLQYTETRYCNFKTSLWVSSDIRSC